MYGKALTDDDIGKIDKATKEELNQMSITAFNSLNPRQKRYCEEYLLSKHERTASMSAGYTDTGIAEQLVRLRKNLNVCLYISCREELEKREKQAEIQAQADLIGDSLRYLHRVLMHDPAVDADFKPDDNKITAAKEILKVLKPDNNQGKSRTFGIKKSEKLRDIEQTGVKQSKSSIKPQRINEMEFVEDD